MARPRRQEFGIQPNLPNEILDIMEQPRLAEFQSRLNIALKCSQPALHNFLVFQKNVQCQW